MDPRCTLVRRSRLDRPGPKVVPSLEAISKLPRAREWKRHGRRGNRLLSVASHRSALERDTLAVLRSVIVRRQPVVSS